MPRTAVRRAGPGGWGGTDPRLPVPPELARVAAAAAADPVPPPGGDLALRAAAAAFLNRSSLPAHPARTLLAPGPAPLLTALLAAAGGGLLLPRPSAPWYAPAARLLGRPVRWLPVPAGCGGVPDPVALQEAVRREGAGRDVLVLAPADDPTGTVAPPQLVHEVCEAAAGAGLLIVSDETFTGLPHGPATVLPGPAGVVPDRTVVLRDLAAGPLPAAWPAAVAAFPAAGPAAALHAAARAALSASGAVLAAPVARAAAAALAGGPAGPDGARALRLHAAVAAAAHAVLLEAGAMCRPPAAGFHLYPDFGTPSDGTRPPGADGRRVAAVLPGALEGALCGDRPGAARVRLAVPALYGEHPADRERALAAADPAGVAHVAEALAGLRSACAELTGT